MFYALLMKLLVVKLSSLGDLFHALPAVHNIREQTGAEIHWAAHTPYAELVGCFGPVARVVPCPRQRTVAALPALARTLAAERYDLALDMQGLLKSALVARLARAKKTVGPSFHREGSRLFYSAVAGPRNKSRHAVEENMDFVDWLGLERVPPAFPIRLPDRPLPGPGPQIALLPQSRWATKNWPVACFADVVRRLQRHIRPAFWLLGDDKARDACAAIERAADGTATNLAGSASLVETAALLRQADLLIANDSGPVHMAAALGTPTLVVFGATDPARTGPYGTGHRVLSAKLPCQPCFSRHCRRNGLACLQGVTPEHVAETALAMLRHGKGRPTA